MFGLILLPDGSYDICDVKRIFNRRKDNRCTVKLHNNKPCNARLLVSHDSCDVLVDIKKSLSNGSPKVCLKPITFDSSTPNVSFNFDLSSTLSPELKTPSDNRSNGIDQMEIDIHQNNSVFTSNGKGVHENSENPLTNPRVSASENHTEDQITTPFEFAVPISDQLDGILENTVNYIESPLLADSSCQQICLLARQLPDLKTSAQERDNVTTERIDHVKHLEDINEDVLYDIEQCYQYEVTVESFPDSSVIKLHSDEHLREMHDLHVTRELSASDGDSFSSMTDNNERSFTSLTGEKHSEGLFLKPSDEKDICRKERPVLIGNQLLPADLHISVRRDNKESEKVPVVRSSQQNAHGKSKSPDVPEAVHVKKRKVLFDMDSDHSISDNDSDYDPEQDESLTDVGDEDGDLSDLELEREPEKKKNLNGVSGNSGRFSISFTGNEEGTALCDDSNTTVEQSQGPAGGKKWNFCLYCAKPQSKISRHLQRKHKDEKEVMEFSVMPPGYAERKHKIDKLRKKGNFLFNTNPEHNNGRHLVVRRPNQKFTRTAKDFAYCAKCKGSYSKNTIAIHFAKCTRLSSQNNRLVMLTAKQVAGRIHPSATDVLRRRIFPVLRDDVVTCAVRYDELVIAFANKQAKKYKSQHFDKMIRSQIRTIGRFLLALQKINKNVTDLTSVFDPEVYEDAISAVNIVAGLNDVTSAYQAPSTASSLGTLLKQIGKIRISMCIKTKQREKLKDAEDFLKLLDEDYTVSVNKVVAETQAQQKRRKKVVLPSTDDVHKLHDYLEQERKKVLNTLKYNFSVSGWRYLAETTLTSVQLFNRRRAGEVERILIEDFNNHQGVDRGVDNELYRQLSEPTRAAVNQYVRFTIRGKLNRTVPVLLSSNMLECIKLILEYRAQARVSTTNPYVFGMPTNNKTVHKHLNACLLMRKFSSECGATNPNSLRGTELRKHMATKCLSLNLNDQDVGDVANFMGHSTDIHKNVYRQAIVSREIVKMSQLLEKAQGVETESDSEEEIDENDFNGLPANTESNQENPFCTEKDSENHKPQRGRPRSKAAIDQQPAEADSYCPPKTKKRHSGSPHGPIKRVPWSREEKDHILKEFGTFINSDSKTFPSLKSIGDFISKVPVLQSRTSQQVKAWMSNQKAANRRLEYS